MTLYQPPQPNYRVRCDHCGTDMDTGVAVPEDAKVSARRRDWVKFEASTAHSHPEWWMCPECSQALMTFITHDNDWLVREGSKKRLVDRMHSVLKEVQSEDD